MEQKRAKKIFTWISENIPWAGAREYSTIENISDYCIRNMHGDCGIKTILLSGKNKFSSEILDDVEVYSPETLLGKFILFSLHFI